MKRLVSIITGNWPIVLIFFLQIPLILPFFHRGFFPSHDNVQVVRVFEMFQSLKYGDIPPRWSANLLFGYGYPLYIFYSPLPFFIGALFSFFGFNFLISTKIVFILSFFMGGLGIYLLAKEWWGKLPAFITSIAFSYAPYRAIDVYVRGNLAEFFAFSLFPLVFWLNWKFLTAQGEIKKRWAVFFCFFLFLQELSHNISCFIFFLFLLLFNIFYLFIYERKDFKINFINLVAVFLLSFLLSSFFLVPLFYESKFVMVGKFINSPYQEYFLTLGKAWNSPWGWGGYLEGNALSLRLGKTLIIFSFLSFLSTFLSKGKLKKLSVFFCFNLFFFLFLELKASLFIWEKIPLLHYLQFPWRFHTLSVILMSILSGGFFYQLLNIFSKKKTKYFLIYFFSIVFLILHFRENFGFFKPQYFSDAPAVAETTTWDDEYLPKWVKVKPKDYTGEKVKFVEGEGKILSEKWGYLTKSFRAEVESQKAVVQIAHVYYPGWQVYVNNKKEEIIYDNDLGAMGVLLPQRDSEVVFKFERTNWRFASDVISIVGLAIFGYLLISSWSQKKIR